MHIITKICTKCKIEKDLTDFSICNRNKDKLEHFCRVCKRIEGKKTYERNKSKVIARTNAYYQKNKSRRNKYYKNRRKTDVVYKLTCVFRSRFYDWLNGNYKTKNTFSYINCSKKELIEHLESQFYDNPETGEKMTWENWSYEGWHIDHIIPLAQFNPASEDDMYKACAKENLQPLWSKENIIKRDKICQ